MKIKEEQSKIKYQRVDFGSLEQGDLFYTMNALWMKTEPYVDSELNTINAVCLKDGGLDEFYDSTLVDTVTAEELVWHREVEYTVE